MRTAKLHQWQQAVLYTALVLLLPVLPAYSAELSDQEQRGRIIYHEGKSSSGTPITVLVSRGGTPISASLLPCSGCHGKDGKGRPEGGVKPSDITWKTLTASYGHEHDYGRSHPAYDEMSLARSVIIGRDPADNELDMAMPRYSLSESDIMDLVAYIKKIEIDLDPGLDENVIRLGTLLPLEGSLQGLGQSMRSLLESYFADINANGGIHGRRIELVAGEYAADPVQAGWKARDFLRKENIFALVSGYTAGVEVELAELAEDTETPFVGPFTVSPQEGGGLYSNTFYLLGGMTHQAQVLTRHAMGELQAEGAEMAVVRPNAAIYQVAQEAAQAQRAFRDAESVLTLSYTAPFFDAKDTASMLAKRKIRTVLFFGTAKDFRRLADECGRLGWTPDLFLPGVFAGQDMFEIPESYAGQVLLGYSSMPSDHTENGIRAFEKLHADHGFGYQHSTAQISAFAAAQVMVEGLKRAGRDLSRDRLVRELEGLSDFHAGLVPPVSYNATRRIGALGGYVVQLDLKNKSFGQASKWIELQP
jgi:ABC-type branched-subunit amino acid transport system substrate-binding protein